MTVIVDKDIKKIVLNRSSGSEEKIFHVEQDTDLILIGIEEIKYEEENK